MKTAKIALKSLIAAAAIGAALTGMSATAQIRHSDPYRTSSDNLYARGHGQINERIDTMRDRIVDSKRAHRLSNREATRLLGRLDKINDLKVAYMRTGRGLDRNEVSTLQTKLDRLSADIRYQGRDSNRS